MKRTRFHIRRQLNCTDRVHKVNWDSPDHFGTLGKDLRGTPDAKSVAREFIDTLSILYLVRVDQPGNDTDRRIRTFEGVISHAAAYLLDSQKPRIDEPDWETTNTLSKNSRWKVSPEKARKVATMLNRILGGSPILPTEPRI